MDSKKGTIKSRRHDFDKGELKCFEKRACVYCWSKSNETG